MRNGFRILAWLSLALVTPLLLADARPGLTVHETVLRSDPAGNGGAPQPGKPRSSSGRSGSKRSGKGDQGTTNPR